MSCTFESLEACLLIGTWHVQCLEACLLIGTCLPNATREYSICGPYMSSILISHGYGWMRKILAAQILTHSTHLKEEKLNGLHRILATISSKFCGHNLYCAFSFAGYIKLMRNKLPTLRTLSQGGANQKRLVCPITNPPSEGHWRIHWPLVF